jgi:gliding motility-associated-like protein
MKTHRLSTRSLDYTKSKQELAKTDKDQSQLANTGRQGEELTADRSERFSNLANFLFVILLSVTAFFIGQFTAGATHVVGGGITYTQIEGTQYNLQLKLYRDCSPGTYPLPASVDLELRYDDGSLPAPSSINMPLITNELIEPAIPACAFDPGICVEEAIYESTVYLPEGVGGFHMYFTICCRNATIINIVNPLTARETYYAYMPNPITTPNSSPYFNNMPPVYVCQGTELDLDFSATDIDGDSLVYNFYTPFDGFNGTGITYTGGAAPNNINISPVTWQAGFNATDPLDPAPGFLPGLTISDVGLINGVPAAAGQYVLGVMVDEYRDGILIGRITRDFQFNVINCPPPIEAGIDIITNCNGLNIDFLNTSSVTATDFWWDFGTGDPADSSLVFEPSFTYGAAGTYTVMLIVQKGTDCADTATFTFTIDNPLNFTVLQTDISCDGLTDGGATVDPTDGTYNYEWSDGGTDFDIDGLAVGTYWVEATNSLGCFDTVFFPIAQPAPLDATFDLVQPSCFEGEDGMITANPGGGTAPYTYNWLDPPSTDPTVTDIGDGTYTLTITDANGCEVTLDATLVQPPELIVNLVSIVPVNCNGDANGEATVAATGGTGAYTIDWLGLEDDDWTMDGLVAGTYIVEVTDANGCQAILVVEITEPDPIFVDAVVITEETCSDQNGSVFADVTGGVGTLTFEWDPASGSGDVATGLSSGTVSVTVTDENGCQATASVFVPDNLTGVASIGGQTPVLCAGGNNGTATVIMTGGAAPFSYDWSCVCPDSDYQDNLSAGDYTVTITDANGCIETIDITIDELPELVLAEVSSVEPLCFGDENGSAEVLATGGTGPYEYSWNTVPVQLTAMASGIGAGIYTVNVTDSNGCSDMINVPVNQPDELILTTEVLSNILCNGDSAGVAAATPSGGTPTYSILWLELGATTDTVDGLVAGTYTVTATDANGCEVTEVVQIIEYDKVTAEIIYDSIICPGETVVFTVLANDDNNLYDFNWYVNDVFQLEGNVFSYTITDTTVISIDLISDYGCPPIYDTVVVEPIMIDPAGLHLTGTEDTICLGSSAIVQVEIDDLTYVTDLWWDPSDLEGFGPHNVVPEGPTSYTVTIRNVCGEEYSETVPINVYMPPAVWLTGAGTTGCDEVNVAFQFDVMDYEWPITGYSWDINSEHYTDLNPIVMFDGSGYADATLNLTFANGCTFSFDDQIGLTVYDSPEADFYYNPDPAIQAEVTEFIDISKGNPEFWEWYLEGNFFSNEERPTHVFEETGEYEVMEVVIDYNGCTDTVVHTVVVIGDFLIYVPNAFTPDGNQYNNEFKPVMTNVLPEDYEFLIFNRWGEVIYQTNNLDDSWDGSYRGDAVLDDVYVWKINVRDNRAQRHELYGHVTVLR